MKVISDKDLRVATLSGAVVLFKAGEERTISDSIGAIALQMGARQIGNSRVEIPKPVVDEPEIIVEASSDEETGVDQDLVAVLQKLIELGNPEDFKPDGTPKATVVNKAIGRTVRTDEREQAWELALNA